MVGDCHWIWHNMTYAIMSDAREHNALTTFSIPFPGVRFGHATDPEVGSGTTVCLFDEPAIAAAHVMGASPGTRETETISPARKHFRMTMCRKEKCSPSGTGAVTLIPTRCAGSGSMCPLACSQAPKTLA